jgi:hypothetical protein
MRLTTFLTVSVTGICVALACWGATRLRENIESVEAQVLAGGPDLRPPAPRRNADSEIVFEEFVIRARPARKKPAKPKAFRTEPRPPQTASR